MIYTEDQLTPWIDPAVQKPKRVGVYQRKSTQKTGLDYGSCMHFSYWDGTQFCISYHTPEEAVYWGAHWNPEYRRSREQNTPWRGLNFNPTKKGKHK